MKTARFRRFGDPSAIEIVESTPPRARPHEVLIRVSASSVNSVDVSHRSGRLRSVAGRRFPQGLGVDAVGTVESVGSDVVGFTIGERVWAIRAGVAGLRNPLGMTAEFAAVDARRVARAPQSLDDVEAAALVTGGYTALRALRDVIRPRQRARVVIRGASGGVGSAAVSIAAAMDAHVVGLASGRNLDMVRELGAAEVFDYASATPDSVGPTDGVLDTVGTHLMAWRRTLRRGGRMATVSFDSLVGLGTIGLSVVHGPRRIRAFAGEPPAGHLAALAEFVDEKRIRPVVGATFPLDDLQKAHETFAGHGVAGKLVVTV